MITYDPAKRASNLAKHRLDFDDAAEVFAGKHADAVDERQDYGEDRYVTAGFLRGRMVVLVWTPRDDNRDRHIISMRHCHANEQALWQNKIGR